MDQGRTGRDTMVRIKVYVEGGGDSKEQHARCREGFRKLFEKAGFKKHMPSFIACGGRKQAYDDFCTALNGRERRKGKRSAYPLLLVDSEDPVVGLIDTVDDEFAWVHLQEREGWDRPDGSDSQQALLMATCMESWIVSDRQALHQFYGQDLQESALPPLHEIENRRRQDVQQKLSHATRNSKKAYRKGNRSFAVLAELDPEILKVQLSQFRRMLSVLEGFR